MRRKCHTCLCWTCLNTCCSRKICIGKKESCKDYSGFRQVSIFEQEPKQNMQVLVACEESQRVCMEFRRLGHEAYSCDIEPCSGGHPEWHIQADVLPLLNGDCSFRTVDGIKHRIDGKWDMVIAFPPCTYLSGAGAAWLYPQKGVLNQERYKKGMEAKEFFMEFYNADCPRIAIENPVPTRVYGLPEYSQIIQPYEHGHPYSKKTCLWLKGLPALEPTRIVTDSIIPWVASGSGHKKGKNGTKFRDAKTRSKTFPGIAKAMAEQWGKVDNLPEPKYQKAPRYSWEYYNLDDKSYRKKLYIICQSGKYDSIIRRVAYQTNKDIALYLIKSVTQDKSYDALEFDRELGRISYGKSDFYGIRRRFFYLFDLELKKNGIKI